MAARNQPDEARIAAQASREKTYQGKPCAHGHNGWRYTATAICIACNDERNARRKTGNKPGRPPKSATAKKPQPPRKRRPSIPRAQSIARTLSAALADDRHTISARERSDHLDNLTKNLIASKVLLNVEE